jgi:nitroimidazol reductase NimA-like FMN-containing flavoprotein (pyridoxamine 5'-phosphate oxidase superfamily)
MTFHLRRKDKEITDESLMKKILKTSQYITMALCRDSQPYLVSLSHAYDENRNCLYFHCAKEGKKLQYLNSNDVVWGQALLDYGHGEGDECTHLYASVHFCGRVTLIKDLNEKRQAMICMINQLEKNPKALIANLDNERLRNSVMGRIDVEYMTGKKSKEVTI